MKGASRTKVAFAGYRYAAHVGFFSTLDAPATPLEYAALMPVKAFCERSLRERQYYPKFPISSIDPASHKSHLVLRSENDCNEWITKQRPGFIRADWRINTKAGRVCDLPHTSDLWDMIGYCADMQQRLLVPPKKKEKNKKLSATTVRKICAGRNILLLLRRVFRRHFLHAWHVQSCAAGGTFEI